LPLFEAVRQLLPLPVAIWFGPPVSLGFLCSVLIEQKAPKLACFDAANDAAHGLSGRVIAQYIDAALPADVTIYDGSTDGNIAVLLDGDSHLVRNGNNAL
jgi:hypothetical protein